MNKGQWPIFKFGNEILWPVHWSSEGDLKIERKRIKLGYDDGSGSETVEV